MTTAHILLGVTGSIAAFKACHLASDWSKQGHEVRVVMTAAAQEFVTPLTFTSLTHTPTRTAMFAAQRTDGDVSATAMHSTQINHVDDAKWADILVVAPASADSIAKIACGIADDQLTSTILAYDEGPKVLCPAMNVHMYANAVTQRNLQTCRELGWTIVEPESGMLACRDIGKGRMEEPAGIEAAVADLLHGDLPDNSLPLKGRNVLVTAGPTQEPLDPVRYLTNHSTGKMGYAIAEQARDMGAKVTLVSGPVSLQAPHGVDVVNVRSAQEMFRAVQDAFANADITIMAAAVGDFRPAERSAEKIKKNGRERITLELVSNPDILAWAGANKRDGQTLCGFAMETIDPGAASYRTLAEDEQTEPGRTYAHGTCRTACRRGRRTGFPGIVKEFGMLLIAVDIGNTNVVLGFIHDGRIAGTYRITTKANHTSDEYGLMITQFLKLSGFAPGDVDDVIISSVVPKVMHSFRASIVKFLDIDPMIVGPGVKTGINIRIDNPKSMGADCIADCAGAYYEYGGPILVADFGTATTFNYVTADASVICGLITTGIRTGAAALWDATAQLPEVEITRPKSILATSTKPAMQAGLYYNFLGGIERTIMQFHREIDEDFRVVATGGLSRVFADDTDMIDIYDPELIFKGMLHIYERNVR